ncbi:hypothetical protein LY76DRAFT_590188 [Colletotrichum caudatum]|nr:hypothetical protein LY76DRAFT_590188 [Colletotrichum caudatum]
MPQSRIKYAPNPPPNDRYPSSQRIRRAIPAGPKSRPNRFRHPSVPSPKGANPQPKRHVTIAESGSRTPGIGWRG